MSRTVALRTRIPFFILLGWGASLAMLAPAIVGVQTGHFATARAFFYSSLMLAAALLMVGIAISDRRPQNLSREHLLTLAGAYIVLPLILAVPFREAVHDTTYLNAVFEMVSCFTTTGATAFDPGRLDAPLHLWRAEVGWLGGLFTWITAAAILAPLNLGGFEVSATSEPGRGVGGRLSAMPQYETGGQRLLRVTLTLAPLYAGLTMVLWVCLILVGNDPMPGLIRAMGTMSTSGISGAAHSTSALTRDATELLTFFFLFFALSRRTFSTDSALSTWNALTHDPEIRTGVFVVGLATFALFGSHFWGAIGLDAGDGAKAAIGGFASLRGIVFTTLSFLTTTGYVSSHWAEAQQWSGLGSESFALTGLALLGGGVATTAGGVKLLRVYALYVHSRRELSRLVHPSVVSSRGKPGRLVPLSGAYIAWVFFMLFASSITGVWLGLAAFGLDFEHAMLLAVSALSTTGPLAPVVSGGAVSYATLIDPVKELLIAAMVMGRLETLALIALLNTEFWRG